MAQPNPPAYEVRCHACNVSFPVGTKRCFHCGERILRESFFRPATDADGMPVFQEAQGIDTIEEPEDAEPQRGGRFLRVGITLVWIVLALISAAVRSCQDG